MKTRYAALSTLALTLTLALAGCGSSDDGSDDGSGGTDQDSTLTVFAAASLTKTFEEIADEFEEAHEGVDVELSFGGSSDLVTQIQEGAPADVFASADEANMAKLVDDDLAGTDPVAFASNTLQIVVPAGNPMGIATFADLTQAEVNLVICAPEVPCGAATQKAAEGTGVTLTPVSEEQSVTDVLGKVTAGEADAGLVYVTDVTAAGDDVQGIAFPEADSAVNVYPISVVKGADDTDLAQEFVDLVLAETGQNILSGAGFAPAPAP